MSRYIMAIDANKCINCKACVLACQQRNGTPYGHSRNWVRETPDKLSLLGTAFSKEDTFVQEVLENVMKQFHMSADLFPDAPKADQASLREFTFICMLSLDIYLKKQLIEAILDKK